MSAEVRESTRRSVTRNGSGFLERAFDILRAVGARPGASLAAISRETGIPKTTVHRIVAALVDVGALAVDGDSLRLEAMMFALGAQAPRERLIRDLSLPALQHLRAVTACDVNLAVLQGLQVLYLERIPGPLHRCLPGGIGRCLPALYTGVGKALMAFRPAGVVDQAIACLPEPLTAHSMTEPTTIRAQLADVLRTRLAYDREESGGGVTCVASPIFVGPIAVASVSVSSPAGRPISSVEAAVTAAAATLTRRLTGDARARLFA